MKKTAKIPMHEYLELLEIEKAMTKDYVILNTGYFDSPYQVFSKEEAIVKLSKTNKKLIDKNQTLADEIWEYKNKTLFERIFG